MAEKKYFHDIKLVGSNILDDAGNRISLTSTERLGITNAYGGPISETNPLVSKTQYDNDFNSIRAGLRWRDPVNTLSDTAPLNPVVDDRYINTTDKKIYTCAVSGDWGSGETPQANWTVFAKDTDEEWTYDLETNTWVMKSSGSIPYATEEMPGKVKLAPNGSTNLGEAVQGSDSRLLKGYYSETLSNPTGAATITHNLGSAKLFVQAWVDGLIADVSAVRNASDPTNKLDITINGTPASVEVNIIALP